MRVTAKRIISMVVLAVAAIGLTAAFTARTPPVPGYQTAVVEPGDLQDVVLASGVVRPEKQVDVGVQVNGQLQQLHVKLGQSVNKGDLLATIEPEIDVPAVCLVYDLLQRFKDL